MSLAFVSETSTRRSSLDLTHSDISPSQFDMQIDSALDVDVKPNTDAEAATEDERDSLYFCENIVLKAEDRIFSVPRSGLIEHGTYFQSLLNASQEITNGSFSDAGSSEKHPIVLDGVSKIHFHNFLRIIYPFRGIDPPSGDEHWLGILDLATKWGFHEIKETALTRLEHIFNSSSHERDPVRALYLCQKYNISQHIKHQYETIITSITPLDRPAMLAGGIDEETVLHLMQLREKWFCGLVWGEKGSKTGFGGLLPCRVSARKIVEDHFSGSGSVVQDNAVEDTRIREEVSRLSATVNHLEEMESVLIEADREKRLAEAKAEVEQRAEEEAEGKRAEEEEMVMTKEAGASGLREGFVQANDDEMLPPAVADDDLSDIQSIASDMSTAPSPTVGHRVQRLIVLHAQKYEIFQKVREMEANGVDSNNPRMKKLRSVMQTYERKIQRHWERGTEQLSFTDMDFKPGPISLGSTGKQGSREKIKETLESLLGPYVQSLTFSVQIGGNNSTLRKKQMQAWLDTRERYTFLPYSTEDKNRRWANVNIPADKFGEWLSAARRSIQTKQVPVEPELDDPLA